MFPSTVNSLRISNEDTFTLTRDSDETIGQGMSFKIADTPASELRYYPFVEKTLGNVTSLNDTTPVGVGNITTPVEGNDTIGDNVTTETPTEEDNNVTTETPNEGETPATNETGTKNDTPGFGFVFGLVGLLAVVYLVRRNN